MERKSVRWKVEGSFAFVILRRFRLGRKSILLFNVQTRAGGRVDTSHLGRSVGRKERCIALHFVWGFA